METEEDEAEERHVRERECDLNSQDNRVQIRMRNENHMWKKRYQRRMIRMLGDLAETDETR
jgi:hypothetical protein